MLAMSFLWVGPPTVSVLPEGPVRVKAGKSVTLECVSAGEPRSSARWTRIGAPTIVEQRLYGVVDSHTVLQVRQVFPWEGRRNGWKDGWTGGWVLGWVDGRVGG